MRAFLPVPTREDEEQVRQTSVDDFAELFVGLQLDMVEVDELLSHWVEFRGDDEWVKLLAALVTYVRRSRGDIDVPLPIWLDLDDAGQSGRLLYFYLFALCCQDVSEFLLARGAPRELIDVTLRALARHGAIHRRKWGTVGVDAGWWMLPILRGELVQVGSLQFHCVTLGVGTLSPDIWYNDGDAAKLGPGFRRGDLSLGIHIPDGADLSPVRVDETLREARYVLSRLWPSTQRRLATCRTWMLDQRLAQSLSPVSNLVQFQRRFQILDQSLDDDNDVLEFVFRRPGAALRELPQTTTLERVIVDVLQRGEHWHTSVGWLDFD